MTVRQLTARPDTDHKQRDENCAYEMSEIAENPEQRGLCPICSSFARRYGEVHIVAGKQLSVRKDDNHQADAKETRCDHQAHGSVAKVLFQYPEHEHYQG